MAKVLGYVVAVAEIGIGAFTGNAALIVSGVLSLAASVAGTLIGAPEAARRLAAVKANVRGSSNTLYVVLGRARVGGVVLTDGTENPDNRHLVLAIGHAVVHPGGCDGIERVWVDDYEVPASTFSAPVFVDPQDNASHDYIYQHPTSGLYNQKLSWRFHFGTGNQGTDARLVGVGLDGPNAWRRGICYTVFDLYRDPNDQATAQAYPGNIPQMTAQIRGWRCYDPRLDSTAGGSGTQRVDEPSTWAFSENPAICAGTYMIAAISDGGMGIPAASIDWASVATAAAICDEPVTIVPSGTEPRYRCGLALDTARARRDNLQDILDCMQGTCVRSGALYSIFAGDWSSPVAQIDDTWLAGDLQITAVGLEQLYNTVQLTYSDPAQGWQAAEAPHFVDDTYIAADGGEQLVKQLAVVGCPSPYQAQRIAALIGRRSRRQGTVTIKCNLKALQIAVWDVVTLAIGASPRRLEKTIACSPGSGLATASTSRSPRTASPTTRCRRSLKCRSRHPPA
jgi:Phage-related protein, tail component